MQEYVFTLKDGTVRHEVVDDPRDVHSFMEMHHAVSGQTHENWAANQDRLAKIAAGPSQILNMFHGRKTVDEEMDDWGFDGPVLKGISYLACTYMTTWRLGFISEEHFQAAQKVTGWKAWDHLVLAMEFESDMLKTKDGWFGDWNIDPEEKA